METWNNRLARAMSEAGYTPSELARAIGVKPPSISAWIGAGQIRPATDIKAENLLRLSEILGVRPEWLLFGRLPMRRISPWPFSKTTLEEFEALPEHEKARIERFIRDTIDAWEEMQPKARKAG